LGNYICHKKILMQNNSKIILGTAQFGNIYGFQKKFCGLKKSINIIDFAKKKGVKEIDTALSYGNLVELSNSKLKGFKIILKININKDSINNPKKNIIDEILKTLLILKKKKIESL